MTVAAAATVKVNADIRDLKKGMTDAERLVDRFADSNKRGALGVGRLTNSVSSLVTSMTGVPPIVGQVSTALSAFAVGGLVTAGVTIGLAAIVAGYRALNKEARESKKGVDSLVASLLAQADAAYAATLAGKQMLATQMLAAEFLAERDLENIRSQRGPVDPLGIQGRREDAAAQRLADIRRAMLQAELKVLEAQKELSKPGAAGRGGSRGGATGAGADGSLFGGLTQAQITRALENERERREAGLGSIAAGAQAELASGNKPGQLVALLSDQVKAQTGFVEATRTMGDKLRDGLSSISGHLMQGLTNVAASMLFLGGKGKGSQIGGFAGGTLGAGIGTAMGGPVGGAVGTLVGTLAGSLFGGLFDKKKKVANGLDMMATQLARVNQQLRNMPSGYKIARGQHNATEVGDGPHGPGDRPTRPPTGGGGGGGVAAFSIQNLTIVTPNPQDFIRQMKQLGTRGGGGLELAMT